MSEFAPDEGDEEEEFEAERIIGDALIEDENGMIVRKWLVKWKGYDEDDDDTYEPEHYLRHLEIWKEYNNNTKSANLTRPNNKVLNLVHQYNELQALSNTITALTENTSDSLLFPHQSLNGIINQKKLEKLMKNSHKLIVSKVSDFSPQEIYEGITTQHGNIQLYKECIKIFTKYIQNKRIELQTVSDLNMHTTLVDLLKFDDSELQYLCVYILDLIASQSPLNHTNIHSLDINILLKCIETSEDKEIIANIVSILHKLSMRECNMALLIDKDICKYLQLICHSDTSINTLAKISDLLSSICKFKALSNENIVSICHCLSFLIMFDVDDILKPAIYAYNQVSFLLMRFMISVCYCMQIFRFLLTLC